VPSDINDFIFFMQKYHKVHSDIVDHFFRKRSLSSDIPQIDFRMSHLAFGIVYQLFPKNIMKNFLISASFLYESLSDFLFRLRLCEMFSLCITLGSNAIGSSLLPFKKKEGESVLVGVI
jgi:hypothetical protein